jgi:2-methylcitrate dehydratase PrpD
MAAAVGFSGRSNGNCIVLGTNHLVAATTAAFVNGAAAHALDFDDNCYAGVVHGSAVIAPAALALAQQTGASGSELLTAFVVGSESEYAFGAALDNVLYEQGWWTTGVLGPIGSCVAASRLLGLGPERMTSALGLALAGAGGSKSCFGTDAKPLLAGRASEAGIVCALLSAQGAVGPINAIESPSGFANLFNSGRFCQASLEKLGVAWFASYPGVDIKRIPVCLSSHAAVDAVMQIVTEHNIAFNKIESIKCDVPNIVRKNLVYDRPTSVQQSQFSMPFAIAVSLAYGTIKLEHLNERWLSDKSIDALMSRVQMDTGPRWLDTALNKAAPEGAHVSIRLTDGQHFEEFRATARGSVAYPLTKLEIETKFTQCAGPVIGDEASNSLLARLNSLDRSDPISKLF